MIKAGRLKAKLTTTVVMMRNAFIIVKNFSQEPNSTKPASKRKQNKTKTKTNEPCSHRKRRRQPSTTFFYQLLAVSLMQRDFFSERSFLEKIKKTKPLSSS
jgi:hypothetical protein